VSTVSRPRLLVTRPAARQEPFGARARALGLATLAFPCVEIRPEPDLRLPCPEALRRFEAVLFTSRSSVEVLALRYPFPWPGVRALAIGAATGAALLGAGQPLARTPLDASTSEALVGALARTAPLESLLVIKGHGGRELVETSQRARGTRVETLAVYTRARPTPDAATRHRVFTRTPPDILSATSDEILDNLVALAAEALPNLLPRPLIVNSERSAARAREHGFTGAVTVATPPGDTGQLAALGRWLATR